MKITLKELNIEMGGIGWTILMVILLLVTVCFVAQFPAAVQFFREIRPLFS